MISLNLSINHRNVLRTSTHSTFHALLKCSFSFFCFIVMIRYPFSFFMAIAGDVFAVGCPCLLLCCECDVRYDSNKQHNTTRRCQCLPCLVIHSVMLSTPKSQGQGLNPQGQDLSTRGQGLSTQGQDLNPQGQGHRSQGQGFNPQGQALTLKAKTSTLKAKASTLKARP